MKGFLKFLGAVVSVFGVVLGALAVFDKIVNRNKIKDEYLDCSFDTPDNK